MNVLIAGDYCDNGRVSSLIHTCNHKALFTDAEEYISSVDFSLVNFEFPVVLGESQAILKAGPHLSGQRNAVDVIKQAGFNVCTLANNHILDQGEKCCLDTVNLIEEAGIKTVGVGKNLEEASQTLFLHKNGESLAVINCCEHEFSVATDKTVGANPLNPIQQYYKIKEAKNKADYVLIVVHGGHEMYQLPSPRMKETYRFFVDSGADAVVNHHQHCYSGYEVYHDKPIFYGIGNFIFDWEKRRNSIWNEGFMVNITFEKYNKPFFRLFPFIQCNEKPCLELMKVINREKFFKRIEELNEIIADDSILRKQHEQWMIKGHMPFQKIFEPYSNKLLSFLYYHHLLPSFITKRKRTQILDYINCESHLDKLRFVMNNNNKK